MPLLSDILHETAKWYRWPEIAARVPVVVIGRAGYAYPSAPFELPAIASAQIRQRVQARQSIVGLVPAAVADYIDNHDLYRG